jgi:hypothetical protein
MVVMLSALEHPETFTQICVNSISATRVCCSDLHYLHRGIVVSIMTRIKAERSGFESRQGQEASRPTPGSTQPPVQWAPETLPLLKQPGPATDHSPQISVEGRVRLKPDGTRWRTGGEVKGKLANGVGSQYSSHYLGTWCIQHY